MTTEQKTQFIREKCIEANPSIVKLGFGCEVKRYSTNDIDTVVLVEYISNDPQKGHYFCELLRRKSAEHFEFKAKREEVESWKIIGRPLTLEDILMAWDKKAPKSMKTGRAMEIVWGIFCEWTLGKPLTEQSEELKDFVYEILKDE